MGDLKINTKSKGEVAFPPKPLNVLDLDALREHVKQAASMINTITISVAFALDKIMQSGVWQTQWGYVTWRDYIKSEAGISEHRATRLERMVKRFKFLKVSEEDLEEIGYSKAFLLVALGSKKYDLLDEQNINKWLDYAKLTACTYRDFEHAVEKAKEAKKSDPNIAKVDPPKKLIKKTDALALENKEKAAKIKADVAKQEAVKDTDENHEVLKGHKGENEISSGPVLEEEDDSGVTMEEGSISPGISVVEQKDFKAKLYPDQLKVVQAALDKAKQASGYETPGMLLELISAEYLAQAPVEFQAGPAYLQFLCDCMSKVHGVKFSYEKASGGGQVQTYEDEDEDDIPL